MSERVQQFNKRLSEAFAGKDYFASHERAVPILREMESDLAVLHEIAAVSLAGADFFERRRINPVLALPVGQDRNYTLIAHCWIPLDDTRTDLTHQSVHHHGKLLLSSMSALGKGYESVLFKSGFRVSEADGATEMQIDKIYKNPRGHLEFVGPDTPHVVFFPAEFTVTYALWSRAHPQASSFLKSLPGVQAYKKKIKAGLQRLGLASSLGLNVVEKLDFYPRDGKLIQIRDRVNYAVGCQESYLQHFFWCLQQMGFGRFDLVEERIRRAGGHARASQLLALLRSGEAIARKMEPVHLGVDRVQFSKRELLGCFQGQGGELRPDPRAG